MENQRSFQVANEQYVAEFPFIKRWLERGDEHFQEHVKIKVERLDLDVLVTEPMSSYDLIFGQVNWFCIGRDNSILCKVKMSGKDYGGRSLWHPFTWFGRRIEGETVQQAIMNLGDKISELAYVVSVYTHLSTPAITIYKLPKSFSIWEFIESERERIKDGVRQKLRKIADDLAKTE